MDPYSKLEQLEQQLEKMLKSVQSLKGEVLETLKENTELKVENQLLREKLDKLTAKEHGSKNQNGMTVLKQIYQSGYHICNMYYGTHRDPSADCMFCLDILDNFGKKSGHK
ncbi:DNA replication initiation control protein YabA [Lactobacillus equicursoris]|uniref:DNA replication initiation control protein YabA n=1 Tax=Lactobacillus equicursoris TaxID=420645 RepID=UPI0003040473|nr:DNA replication initiation control protein YabA [Lactobacillus equicursoris]MDD6386851.1 DNA replication initiation control protein YabA [Lactobacillus equicursoris]MDD6406948.1 DNA replication initiation control protein YabA [Lactobacillus equicursoris]